MKRRRSLLIMGLALAFTLFGVSAAQGQAPGWSRGQQNLAISYDECVRRAPAALQAEGYRIDYAAGNFAVGIKDVHTAVVICSPAPDAKMLVQIVVASNGEGGGIERQRLQAQMERPGAGGVKSLAGTWCREGDPNKPAAIGQSGDSLTFTNEFGNSSRGRFESSNSVLAIDWEGGLRGTLSSDGNRISWNNGSSWLRCGATAGGGGNAGNPGNTGATGNSGGGRNTGGGTGGDVFGPREDNTAFNGTNLTYYPRPSVEQCQRDCLNNANCKGYTWIKAGTYNPGDSAMCYLIAVVTGRSYVAGHISAVKGGGSIGGGGNAGGGGSASPGGNTGATGNTGGPSGTGSSGGTSQVCGLIYQNNGTIFGGADARGPLVVRPNVQARVVHLEVPANTFLNLDAVMIFDNTGTNVALNKPARQSSNSPWTQPNGAQGAVDGHKPDGGYHIHTNIDQNNPSWWEVDLQQVYPIAEIRVYNRLDEAGRAANLKICVK